MPKMHWRPGVCPGPHWGSSRRSPVTDLLVGWGGAHQSQCPPPRRLRRLHSRAFGASMLVTPWKPGAPADLELATVLLGSRREYGHLLILACTHCTYPRKIIRRSFFVPVKARLKEAQFY